MIGADREAECDVRVGRSGLGISTLFRGLKHSNLPSAEALNKTLPQVSFV